ncbi:MAG TPA: glycosyltransferase [Holophaga sp.]|nr:glycosyltransferase [Holophaga sp.]
MRLSVAMIVKNEAGVLPRCLESIRGLWDELRILDTGSTDGTPGVARAFGAAVEPHPWREDFAEARNACIQGCSGDWILVLDADEALDPADHAALRAALEREGVQGYSLPIRNYLAGGAFVGMDGQARRNDGRYGTGSEHSHFYLQKAVRLFRAQPFPPYRGRVHEIVETAFEERGLPVEDLDVAVHHFGKVDAARDRLKQDRYFRLALEEAAGAPDDLQLQYNVIQEGLMVEAWAETLAAAERFRARAERAPMLVWLGGGMALQGLGRDAEALAWFECILAQNAAHAPALAARAESLRRLGRTGEATEALVRALEADPAYTTPFLRLSSLLEEGGDPGSARQVLEAGLDQNPADVLLWEALVGLSARLRDPRVATDAWNALCAAPRGGATVWHQIVIQALRAGGEAEDARRVLAMGLEAFPGHPELLALRESL